jgi:hypothetical protein
MIVQPIPSPLAVRFYWLFAICAATCARGATSVPTRWISGKNRAKLLGAINFDHFALPPLPPPHIDWPQQRFRMLESIGDGPGVMQIAR